jgi:hypothetical protein
MRLHQRLQLGSCADGETRFCSSRDERKSVKRFK